MHLIDIELSHQTLLSDKFKALKLDIAEYSFPNIYLFRDIHHYQLFFKHELFVKGVTRDGETYLMPTFPLYQAPDVYLKEWLLEVDFFFPIPTAWKEKLDPNLYTFEALEKDSDYLFTLNKMRTYEGRDLDAKRNLVRQFLDSYTVEEYPLTAENAPDALKVLERWHEDHSPEDDDYKACLEALTHLNAFQLSGRLFYVDGQPVAFIIGEHLHRSYVFHFAKAIKSFKGVYQYIYQAFAKTLDDSYEWINLEQDLGSPELRQSKHSYHPDLLLEKWRVKGK